MLQRDTTKAQKPLKFYAFRVFVVRDFSEIINF
jgi:hypothetical protein